MLGKAGGMGTTTGRGRTSPGTGMGAGAGTVATALPELLAADKLPISELDDPPQETKTLITKTSVAHLANIQRPSSESVEYIGDRQLVKLSY